MIAINGCLFSTLRSSILTLHFLSIFNSIEVSSYRLGLSTCFSSLPKFLSSCNPSRPFVAINHSDPSLSLSWTAEFSTFFSALIKPLSLLFLKNLFYPQYSHFLFPTIDNWVIFWISIPQVLFYNYQLLF